MKQNDKVQVVWGAPHHEGVVGYFQYSGEGAERDLSAITNAPIIPNNGSLSPGTMVTVYVVGTRDLRLM